MVSWNDAAEMNERVCSEALVIPKSTGLPTACLMPSSLGLGVDFLVLDEIKLFALDQGRVAAVFDLHFLEHLTDDDLDVLVVDLHALQSIDLLNFLDEIAGQVPRRP